MDRIIAIDACINTALHTHPLSSYGTQTSVKCPKDLLCL